MENFGRKGGRGQIKKAEPTVVKLMLTLEELYNGCIKKMTVKYAVSLTPDKVKLVIGFPCMFQEDYTFYL